MRGAAAPGGEAGVRVGSEKELFGGVIQVELLSLLHVAVDLLRESSADVSFSE